MKNYRKTVAALALVLLFAAPAFAESDSAKPAETAKSPATVAVEEVTALKIENAGLRAENLALRIQAAQGEMRRLQTEQESLAKSAAEKAGLKWDDYDLDLSKRQFVKKKESPK